MCGIGGILRVWPPEQRDLALRTPHGQSIPEAWLDILDDAVKHRGPDGQGRFRDRALRADGSIVDVAFIHRRLSIIDHAGGHQPMVLDLPKGALSASSGESRPIPGRLLTPEDLTAHNRRILAESHAAAGTDPELALRALSEGDDRIAVVFNGCIYNHRELRKELQSVGHIFSTDHSDTETIVHGHREWSEGLRIHLEGMYAAAIWSSDSATVELHRDDFGEKPLYEGTFGGITAFASTAAALARLRAILDVPPARFDSRSWLPSWVQFGWNQTGPWDDIRSVFVGSSQPLGGLTYASTDHWFVSLNPTSEVLTADTAERRLRRAVATRLDADVPLACFLSGGIDSALVVALAREFKPDLCTFTVKMPFDGYDESGAAAQTARSLGVTHSVLPCEGWPADDLGLLITQLGLPFGDSSLLPTCWVSRAARAETKVALGGDGGDEMFLGYQRQSALSWLHRFERLGPDALDALAALVPPGASPRSRREKAERLINAARYGGYKELVAIFPSPFSWELGLCQREQSGWSATRHFGMTTSAVTDSSMATTTALRFDRMFYLPEDLLRKSDTASMSVPLEVRAPFLERQLSLAAMNAPVSSLMPRGQRKGLLRQVARKYLPPEIVDRPKMGFAIPIGEWFRTDYGGLRTMLLDHLNSTEPFGPPSLGIDLNMKFIRQMLDEHLGTGPSGRVVRDHSQRLYMLLVLSIWAKWLGGLGKSA